MSEMNKPNFSISWAFQKSQPMQGLGFSSLSLLTLCLEQQRNKGDQKNVFGFCLFVYFYLFAFNPPVVDFFNLVVNILRKVASFLIIYDASFFENCPLILCFSLFQGEGRLIICS